MSDELRETVGRHWRELLAGLAIWNLLAWSSAQRVLWQDVLGPVFRRWYGEVGLGFWFWPLKLVIDVAMVSLLAGCGLLAVAAAHGLRRTSAEPADWPRLAAALGWGQILVAWTTNLISRVRLLLDEVLLALVPDLLVAMVLPLVVVGSATWLALQVLRRALPVLVGDRRWAAAVLLLLLAVWQFLYLSGGVAMWFQWLFGHFS